MLVRRGIRAATASSWVMSSIVMPSATSSSKSSSIAAGVARVEVAGRLVAEQQARRADQRARDRDALLLAAGELDRQEVGAVGDADALERGERALAATLARRRRGRPPTASRSRPPCGARAG